MDPRQDKSGNRENSGIIIYQLFCQKAMPNINPENRHQLRMVFYEDDIISDRYVRLIDLIVNKIMKGKDMNILKFRVLLSAKYFVFLYCLLYDFCR
jgi:hypothetical protein